MIFEKQLSINFKTYAMKFVFLISLSFALLSACKHTKKVTEEKKAQTEIESSVQAEYLGEVQAGENGCQFTLKILKVNAPKDALVLPFKVVYPLNLDVKYTKPGLKLKFTMTPSKMRTPEGCQAEAVVSIDMVSVQ